MSACHDCSCFLSPPCNNCTLCSHIDLDADGRTNCDYTCSTCPYDVDNHPAVVLAGMEPETHPNGEVQEFWTSRNPESILEEMTVIIRDTLMVGHQGARDAALKLMHLVEVPKQDDKDDAYNIDRPGHESGLVMGTDGSADGPSTHFRLHEDGRVEQLATTRGAFRPGVGWPAVIQSLDIRHAVEGNWGEEPRRIRNDNNIY